VTRGLAGWSVVLGAPLLGACASPPPGAASGPSDASATLESRGDGVFFVPPRSPLVVYEGRVDREAAGGPVLGFVGASVHLRFFGRGLTVLLKDFGRGTPQTTNYYDVSVDGGAPRLLPVSPEVERYELVDGLPEGEHQLELFKRVEAAPAGVLGAGKAQILGFLLQGSRLAPPVLPERRLEFIGDSITCGYGNELATDDPELAHYTSRRSNGHKAYGAVTAALLGARYTAVAYSGRGLSRNYAGGPGELLPELYSLSVPDEPGASPWEPSRAVPDAVVINLGTNDFSTPGVDRALFVRRYDELLSRLRGYYPRALLVAALGPMLNDVDPPGEAAWSSARADISAAVEARARAGDGNVRVVWFEPQTAPFGEDFHPTVATHAKMAEQLAPLLKGWLGW
jgi:lysophospholipase L1-like esterase